LPRESKEKCDDHDLFDGRPTCSPQSVLGGFFRVLGSWVNGIVTYLARRQAIQTLSELDDRALRDIGIERSRIESAVRGTVDPDFGRIM
jgi:uncharacterized protein YjiS (DUF1127 family)